MTKTKPHFQLVIGSNMEDHLSQIIAGFEMLKKKGLLTYSLRLDTQYIKSKFVHRAVVEAKINELTLVYDLADGYQSFFFERIDRELNNIEFYFKRSFNDQCNQKLKHKSKIHPLGLNYHVSCRNNPYDRYFNVKKLTGKNLLKDYIYYLRSKKRFEHKFFYENFENSKPAVYDSYNVLFNCRLYDPGTVSLVGIKTAYPFLSEREATEKYHQWREDLFQVTQQRIAIVKALKKNFPDKFNGGVSHDPFSQKLVPELLLENDSYHKFKYLNALKQNNICVSSVGLHGSIGWKFAEFIAAGRAVVSDPLRYDLPGIFKKERNYMEFTNIDSLVNTIDKLINDMDKLHQMEQNNQEYYKNYMRPDKMVYNTLVVANIFE